MTEMTWPPPFTVKKHRLAKGVKLRVTESRGLEITAPARFSIKQIPSILEENKAWIIKHLSRLPVKQPAVLPDTIHLAAINEYWKVDYVACDARFEMIERPNQEVVLIGKVHDKELCKRNLIAWIKDRAKQYLLLQLEIISRETGLVYSGGRVRDQTTLWGSCTINKSISLNYKLIFLPHYLMRHVMIHELAHTIHLNHSEKFWNLVADFDSEWRTHKQELRHADKYMPSWI